MLRGRWLTHVAQDRVCLGECASFIIIIIGRHAGIKKTAQKPPTHFSLAAAMSNADARLKRCCTQRGADVVVPDNVVAVGRRSSGGNIWQLQGRQIETCCPRLAMQIDWKSDGLPRCSPELVSKFAMVSLQLQERVLEPFDFTPEFTEFSFHILGCDNTAV